jgi:hypothetical protein
LRNLQEIESGLGAWKCIGRNEKVIFRRTPRGCIAHLIEEGGTSSITNPLTDSFVKYEKLQRRIGFFSCMFGTLSA